MKSDCIQYCIQRYFNNGSCLGRMGPGYSLLREDHFRGKKPPRKLNNCWYDAKTRTSALENYCNKLCKSDCKFNYYIYTIEKSDYDDYNFVGFKHDIFPDVTFTHIPKITFVSYVSSFGGLMGMWLGLNLLEIFKYFHRKFIEIYPKINEMKKIQVTIVNINEPILKKAKKRQPSFMAANYHNHFNDKWF